MLSALFVALAIGAPQVKTISRSPADPAVLLILTPEGFASDAPTSTFLSTAVAVFESETRLAVLSTEQAGVDVSRIRGCAATTRLSCWLSAVREGGENARYLIVLAVHPSEAGDRLSTLVLDANARPPAPSDSEQDWENELYKSGVRSADRVVPSNDEAALRSYFLEDVVKAMRGKLGEREELTPFGAMRLVVDPRFEIRFTADPIVVLNEPGTVVVDHVKPGTTVLSILRTDDDRVFSKTIEIRSGETAEVIIDYDALFVTDRPMSTEELSLLAAGGAAALTGVVLVGLAAARSSDLRTGCISRSGSTAVACDVGGFVPLGLDDTDLPALSDPTGVQIAPLGVGLILSGATWSLGTLSFGGNDLLWPLLGGVVLGSVGYFALATAGG